jgi:hypothetical protein
MDSGAPVNDCRRTADSRGAEAARLGASGLGSVSVPEEFCDPVQVFCRDYRDGAAVARLNVTLPVRVPPNSGDTVAIKVTGAPSAPCKGTGKSARA